MFRFTHHWLSARRVAAVLLAFALAQGLATAPAVSWNSEPTGNPGPIAAAPDITMYGPVAVNEAPDRIFGPAISI